jgi:filamentous hemagglutinin
MRSASWLSEDPMGAVDSPNLYAFVGWGPQVGTDPMGLVLNREDLWDPSTFLYKHNGRYYQVSGTKLVWEVDINNHATHTVVKDAEVAGAVRELAQVDMSGNKVGAELAQGVNERVPENSAEMMAAGYWTACATGVAGAWLWVEGTAVAMTLPRVAGTLRILSEMALEEALPGATGGVGLTTGAAAAERSGVLGWAFRGIKRLLSRGGDDVARGTLSNLEARKWYIQQESRILDQIDPNLSLRERAIQAFVRRNELRTQARELMTDRAEAARLMREEPNMTLWEIVRRKYKEKGLVGDALWRDILDSSQKSRTSVNKKLGLE